MEFRREQCIKDMEARGRATELSWFKKYFKKIYIDSGLLPQEIPRKAIVLYNEMQKWAEEMAKQREKQMEIMKEEQSKPQGRRWKPSVVTKWDLERGTMYPVEPEIMEVLYNGISHNDEGRRRYLYLRNIENPWDKFYEPQGHGMDYGWRIEERAFPPNKQFATAEVINAEFYRRNGVKGETLRNRPPIPTSMVAPEQI
uniref:Sperm microtubule inner protein 1 C-terminal domain-containing protein n=1 Tax=Lygus hesperus TaxID=30085 RepID=A0A0K8SBH0_LYGHE